MTDHPVFAKILVSVDGYQVLFTAETAEDGIHSRLVARTPVPNSAVFFDHALIFEQPHVAYLALDAMGQEEVETTRMMARYESPAVSTVLQ